jgi:hypothetical protein
MRTQWCSDGHQTYGRNVAVHGLCTMLGSKILFRPAVDIHKIFNKLRTELPRTVSTAPWIAIDEQLDCTQNELGWFIYL